MSQSTLSLSNAPGVPPPLHAFVSSNKFNPSMAIIIVVLLSALIVVAIFSMYVRRCTQGSRDETSNRVAPARNGNQSIRFYERPGEGLDRALIDALPVVSFFVVKTLRSGKEDLECAVCLEKLKEEEALRLLPQCSHVFHTECIDLWLHSHSTCPLCRISLKPTFDGIGAYVREIGEVSRRILDAQEEIFGSARHVLDVDGPVFENEVPDGSNSGVEQTIGGDDERNSARMTLFRNLDSFRQAARGDEIRERLATLSARYPASSTDLHKECPKRASSLSCISFPLQRTGSGSAVELGEFFSSEDIKYGLQRPDVSEPSMNDTVGRLGSPNEQHL